MVADVLNVTQKKQNLSIFNNSHKTKEDRLVHIFKAP